MNLARTPHIVEPGPIIAEFTDRLMAQSYVKTLGHDYTLTAGQHYAWAVRLRIVEEHQLDDTAIRAAALFPKSGSDAIRQASYGAIALEADREVTS